MHPSLANSRAPQGARPVTLSDLLSAKPEPAKPQVPKTSPPNLRGIFQGLATRGGVSDVILKEGEPVRYRANGELQMDTAGLLSKADIQGLLEPAFQNKETAERELNAALLKKGDYDCAFELEGVRVRANAFWTSGRKLALALRILPESVPDLATLGLPPQFMGLLKGSRGLVLVTGSTGSGKTTTLAASIDYINQTSRQHIVTLEDPVEYVIPSKLSLVNQRQVGSDTESFNTGLRAALRQDPDVLLIGELRDYATVKAALDAANTGHLVLGTLHTNNALQTIERVTSFFSDDEKAWAQAVLSQALLGIVSQTLVPSATESTRMLAAELLLNSQDIRQLIREGRSHQIFNVMDTGAAKGHVLLNRVLRDMVKNKLISKEVALAHTYDPKALLDSMTALQ